MTQTQDPLIPEQLAGRTSHELTEAYGAAWNSHSGAAVAALVGGTYVDPTLPEPVGGPVLAGYVDALCAAFPDLRFESVATFGDPDRVAFQWRMRGTNDGAPLPGAPAPTGGSIDLPGLDVITFAGGRILDVVGYFDQKAFVEQLGLQTFVQPQDSWPISFGTAVRMDLGNVTVPGALTLTWLDVDGEGEQQELIARTTEILTGLAGEPGFLGMQGTTVGDRNTTLTLWASPGAAESAMARSRPHAAAMQRMEQHALGTRGFTSLWQPYRLNEQFTVCACGARVPLVDGAPASCACGVESAATPYV